MSQYNTVSVGDSPTLIVAANTKRREIDIVNTNKSRIVYIGQDASVTVDNGFPIYPTQNRNKAARNTDYRGPIYGVAPSGSTIDVRYWETTTV